MAHSYLNTVPEGARQWKKFIDFYKSYGSDREKKAIVALENYVNYEDFNATQKAKLITQGLQPCFRFHPSGSENYERLTSFSRLCVQYLFTDKEIFEAFQKELGGKQNKEDEERRKREEQERKKREREKREQEKERQEREEETRREQARREREKKERKQKQIRTFVWFLIIIIGITFFVLNKKESARIVIPTNTGQFDNIIGSWAGTFNNHNVTLEFLNIENGIVEAQITFPNNQTEKLKGKIYGNRIDLKDVITNNFYDGDYSGAFNSDTTTYIGNYKNPNSGAMIGFRFSKKNIAQNDIVGIWKGWYDSSGKVTLTINADMTGVFKFTNAGRSGSYNVSVGYYNGTYSVKGTEWINRPSGFTFANLYGTISNGIFSGTDFRLEKNSEIPEHKTDVIVKVEQGVDYTVKVENAISKAIDAFDDGRFSDAFRYYNEAANYPTDRSTSIKQNTAKKFKEKAERLIQLNGECDEVSKQLLQYANSLYPSSEIQRLLNKCNSISGVTSSNSYRFPQASERLLSASDLSGLSKYDLKIMRNEIFARHGYIFTTNDMKNYFQNQSWYTPRYSNVTSMLTRIEQQNITLIKRYE